MGEAVKETKTLSTRWLSGLMFVNIADHSIGRILEVWLTKPVARSLSFFIPFSVYLWFLCQGERPEKMPRMLLACGLLAVVVFFLYKW